MKPINKLLDEQRRAALKDLTWKVESTSITGISLLVGTNALKEGMKVSIQIESSIAERISKALNLLEAHEQIVLIAKAAIAEVCMEGNVDGMITNHTEGRLTHALSELSELKKSLNL